MANTNTDNQITVGINQSASQKRIKADLKKVLSQIDGLEAVITHAGLDKSAIRELQAQLDSLRASVKVADIRADQGQAAKAGQKIGHQIGKQMEDTMNKEISLDTIQDSFSALKKNWKEQGVLVDEFKSKVEQLEAALSSLGNAGGQDSRKTPDTTSGLSGPNKTEETKNTLDAAGKSAAAANSSVSTLGSTWSKFISLLISSDQSIKGLATFKNIIEGVKQLTASCRELGLAAGTLPFIMGIQKNGGGLIRPAQAGSSPFLATVECSSDAYDSYSLL